MSERRMQDPEYLKTVAYRDASNLDARIAFWQRYGTSGEAWCDKFFSQVDLATEARVLELGCGPADIWRIGFERGLVPAGWQMTLTDLSPGMVDEARRRLAGVACEFEFRVVDASDIPFQDEAFDVVFANYMLYHVPDVEQVLREVRRVLKPGGRLLAATCSDRHIQEIVELQRQFAVDPSEGQNIRPAHLSFSLESGPPVVSKYFDDVEVSFDESPALADDPDLLMGFLTSTDVQMDVDAMRAHINERIERDGHIEITRASGLIAAFRPG